VALDRNFIERADFSPARKGHDPAEVAEHLAAVAEAVEELKRSRPGPAPVAASAADSVRSIVEAAERSAAEIEAGARHDAERTRAAAEAEATEQVERVRAAAAGLLERADAIEREVGALVHDLAQGLRAGAEGLRAEVAGLRGGFAGDGAGEPAGAEKPPPADTGPDVPPPDVEQEPQEPEAPVEEDGGGTRDEAPAGLNGHPGAAASGSAGARLIALNMALNGTPREETASYLRENFELDEPEQLLDDVYARAGR
jgi:hypothetical protein